MVRLAFGLLLGLALPAGAQDLQLYTLGSGDVSGSYYAAATALCDATNRSESGRMRCSPEATPGSIYNLTALRNRQIDFALVQSDVQQMALRAEGPFTGQPPFADLRSVMALYPETLTILARPGARIINIDGLRGKRVDIGLPTSGRRATVARLFDALGYTEADFHALLELPPGAGIEELCAGRIDATALIVGHPNDAVARAIRDCDARIVVIAGRGVREFLNGNPDYIPASIPRKPYGKRGRTQSLAVIATLVTRADLPDAAAGAMVRNTLGNLTLVGLTAPVLEALSPDAMQDQGLTAPLHPGAEAAFDEAARQASQ